MSKTHAIFDAEAWFERLREELHVRSTIYENEVTDQMLRRNKAMAMIAALTKFLREVPGIEYSDLLPLKDLLIFSEDLDHGRLHPWAKPVSVGGTNFDSVAFTELRIWILMAFLALTEAGMSKTAAYRATSAIAKASKRSIPWRTVQRWALELEKQSDPRLDKVHQRYEDFWGKLPCPHGGKVRQCPASRGACSLAPQIATRFAEWSLTVPALRDRFIS